MFLRGLQAVLLVSFCAGCASWSYSRSAYGRLCREADWEELYYDAEIHRGQPRNISQQRLNILDEACPYHDVKPDPNAKAAALARVEKEFCVFDKAYGWGRAGNLKPKACNDEYGQEWSRGYKDYLVLQLEFLNHDGTYKATYNRYLQNMNVSKKNLLAYGFAKGEAQAAAAQELKIKVLNPKDDKERQDLIKHYSRQLDEVRTSR
jgi:hypothetical protein